MLRLISLLPLSLRRAFSSSSAAAPPAPTHYKITLLRSALGLPSPSRDTLAALGLKKLHQTVYHPFSATAAGQILRVKELVRVENVPEEEVRSREEVRLERRPGRGFVVLGREEAAWAVREDGEGGQAPAARPLLARPLHTRARLPPPSSLRPTARALHTSSHLLSSSKPSSPDSPPIAPPHTTLTAESSPSASLFLSQFRTFPIPRSACSVSYASSSGPGGQNVNKLATKALVRFPLAEPLPAWFPKWALPALRASPYYVASSHSLQMTSSASRSQAANLEDALRKLHELIYNEAERGIVREASAEQKGRVEGLERAEKRRRREEKGRRKGVKEGRRDRGD